MTKLTLRLLVLAAVLALLASFCGGWKWKKGSSTTTEPVAYVVAQAEGWTWE